MPPVVVQPAAPEICIAAKPQATVTEPIKDTQAPKSDTPNELPPVVVQPAPPTDAPAIATESTPAAPIVVPPTPETRQAGDKAA